MNAVRPLAVLAGVVALAATGCKSSPCAPPACMAEAPPVEGPVVAPPPAAAPRATAYRAPVAPAPAVVAPRPDPEMQAKIDVLRTSVEAQHRQNAAIEAKLLELQAGTRAKEAAAVPASGGDGSARKLAEELKGVPGAHVLVEGSNAVVVFTDSFDSGVDRLKNNPDFRAGLRAVAMAMTRHPEARVSITGHTDSVPIQKSKWADNNALSSARAETVAKALAAAGAPRDRMTVKGVGSADPMVSPERTAADRAKNRRVEVEFVFAK